MIRSDRLGKDWDKALLPWLCLLGCLFVLHGCATGPTSAERQVARKNYQEAIPLLQVYLEGDPDSIRSRNILAYSLLRVDRYEEAIAEFNNVLADRENDQHALLYLGLAYLYTMETGKAIEVWQRYSTMSKPLVAEEINRQLTTLNSMPAVRNVTREEAIAADRAIARALQAEALRMAVIEAKLGDCG